MKTLEEIEARMAEIKSEIELDGADFDALSAEIDQLEEERNAIKAETRKNDILAVINGAGEDTHITEDRSKMNEVEFRNSKEYIDAFAEYVKTGDATEVRALISKNAPENGQISVPSIVEDKIRTAWDKSKLFERVGKTEGVKGNLIIDFEISGTDAVVHEEGTDRPDEEELEIGSVTIVPKNIKKWIEVTDEVMDLRGEAFLRYVYDELAYKIVKQAEAIVVARIKAAIGSSTATKPGQAEVTAPVGRPGVVNAISTLSDEAEDLCIIMNRRSWGQYEATRTLNDGDPFADLPVIFNNKELPAYDTAAAGAVYAIVGDLGFGFKAHLPNGFAPKTIVDDKSKAPDDKIVITSKLFAGLEVVGVNCFCGIKKPRAEG